MQFILKLPIFVRINLSDLDLLTTSGGTDVIRLCLDFLTSIATHIHQNNLAGSYAHSTLEHFLQVGFAVPTIARETVLDFTRKKCVTIFVKT